MLGRDHPLLVFYTMFTNDLVKHIKEKCPCFFFQWLHLLVTMDDTVLVDTSRPIILIKIMESHVFCKNYGMEINEGKHFFVINGSDGDFGSLPLDDLRIEYRSSNI